MSLRHNPLAVIDGLTVYFDPANSKSYTGSGNWLDLMNNIDAIPVNSPTLLDENYGIINLDPGDYFTLEAEDGVRYEDSTEFTVSVWYYHDSTTGGTGGNARQYLWDSRPVGGNSNLYAMWIDNGSSITMNFYQPGIGTLSIDRPDLGQWINVVGVLYRTAPTNYSRLYLQGDYVDELTGTASSGSQITHGGYIGTAYIAGYNFDGKLGPFMIHNRALTPSEIQQNYNAMKGRFGLT